MKNIHLTPKEKAKELVDFHNSILINYIQNEFERKYAVIECALIAVNEIYKANLKIHLAKRNIYWQEVKQEIENL